MAVSDTEAVSAGAGTPKAAKPELSASGNGQWNWVPDGFASFSQVFVWPPKPQEFAKWVYRNYLRPSDRTVYIAYAFLVAFWIQPVAPDQAVLSSGWIAELLLRNAVALITVAGGLHLWFYVFNGQGMEQKYDRRPMEKKKMAMFAFNYQTWDNVFYTLVWALPIASAYEVLIRYSFANGMISTLEFSGNEILFVALFPLLVFWQSTHFYFIHRAMHWDPVYKHIHSVHHRNINPGPWSGLSMHPVEVMMYFSTTLIFFVIPAHPVHLIWLMSWQLLGAPSSHAGYNAICTKGRERLVVGDFFHQLHHKYFKCNYGGAEVPWDKWLGTYLDGTPDEIRNLRKRAKKDIARQNLEASS